MFLQRKDSIYDIEWGAGIPYGQVRLQEEVEHSVYGFEVADVEMLRRHFEDWEGEAVRCLEHDPPLVLPALEATLKTSHLFNLLDARGAISVTERVGLIGRVRRNAVKVAKAYVAQREEQGWPLGNALEGEVE
jgi:glycyl-tRNA synthetase alpha chain